MQPRHTPLPQSTRTVASLPTSKATGLDRRGLFSPRSDMIVTHTVNASGHRRVYLGGKSSVECWIEPDAAGMAWTFHMSVAPTGFPMPHEQQRAWAVHTLLNLAANLGVPADELRAVPFERIAALHTSNPVDYRRIAVPKRQAAENGYMATSPDIRRPQADFTSADFAEFRRRS
ncbi:hypothetical protein RLW55_05980 [Hyphomicrobium sp. B1]|uniref:hypothetical protein n=1 Tax=Hyphomicrobium sp. B1 TaxID=3075651 RepID=UPI003C2DA866